MDSELISKLVSLKMPAKHLRDVLAVLSAHTPISTPSAATLRKRRQRDRERDQSVTCHGSNDVTITVASSSPLTPGSQVSSPTPPSSSPPSPLPPPSTSAERRPRKLTQPEFPDDLSEEYRVPLALWFQHKNERRERYKPLGWATLIAQQRKFSPQRVAASVEQSISRNYAGLFTDKIKDLPPEQAPLKLGPDVNFRELFASTPEPTEEDEES